MITARFTSAFLLVCSLLLTQQAVADNHATEASSINLIHPSNFNIDSAEIAEIKTQMQAAVDGEFIPGALLLVGNSDGVGFMESVGYQTPDNVTPVNKDTIFRIYSMTKPVVSVATMMLMERGVLHIDDPVEKFLPEFANLQVIDSETGATRPAQNTMTIANLLSHESGIVQYRFARDTALGEMYLRDFADYSDIKSRDLASRIGKLPVFFEPGTAWHYGHSTDVLGALLEVAANKPLDELLSELIFEPLGMDETSFFIPESKAYRIAEPFHGDMPDNTRERQMLSGGGGLNSTTEDYVRFAAMLLNGGEYRGARILQESTLDLMREKRIGSDVSREYFFYGERGDWGLGFHLQPTTDDPDGPHNFGWRGIGGTLFVVDQENDFYMLYMEQKMGGPRGAPFSNNTAQRMVYEAIRD